MQLPSTSWSWDLSQSTMSGYVSLSAEQTLTHSRFTRSTLLPSPPSLQFVGGVLTLTTLVCFAGLGHCIVNKCHCLVWTVFVFSRPLWVLTQKNSGKQQETHISRNQTWQKHLLSCFVWKEIRKRPRWHTIIPKQLCASCVSLTMSVIIDTKFLGDLRWVARFGLMSQIGASQIEAPIGSLFQKYVCSTFIVKMRIDLGSQWLFWLILGWG